MSFNLNPICCRESLSGLTEAAAEMHLCHSADCSGDWCTESESEFDEIWDKLGQDHARRSPSQKESFVILMFVMLFRILPILLFITVLVFIRDDLGPPVPGLVTDPAEGRGAGGPRLRHPRVHWPGQGVAEMWREPGGAEQSNKETQRQRGTRILGI